MSVHVAFDTSALGTLARDVSVEAFESALRRRRCTPVHALSTAQSALGNPSRVREQFAALRRLGFQRLDELVMPHRLIRAEVDGEVMVGPRFEYRSDLPEVFELCDRPGEFETHVHAIQPGLRQLMGPSLEQAAEGMVSWWSSLPDKERHRLKPEFGARSISDVIVGPRGAATRHFLSAGASPDYADVALADPNNHRASITRAGLLSVYLLGTLMHGEHTPEFSWLISEPDDRNDFNIAVGAAYCAYFVVDDDKFRRRLRFLMDRECVFFHALSTPEFLNDTG